MEVSFHSLSLYAPLPFSDTFGPTPPPTPTDDEDFDNNPCCHWEGDGCLDPPSPKSNRSSASPSPVPSQVEEDSEIDEEDFEIYSEIDDQEENPPTPPATPTPSGCGEEPMESDDEYAWKGEPWENDKNDELSWETELRAFDKENLRDFYDSKDKKEVRPIIAHKDAQDALDVKEVDVEKPHKKSAHQHEKTWKKSWKVRKNNLFKQRCANVFGDIASQRSGYSKKYSWKQIHKPETPQVFPKFAKDFLKNPHRDIPLK